MRNEFPEFPEIVIGWGRSLQPKRYTSLPEIQRLIRSSSVKGGIPTRISTSTGLPFRTAGLNTQRLKANRAASSI